MKLTKNFSTIFLSTLIISTTSCTYEKEKEQQRKAKEFDKMMTQTIKNNNGQPLKTIDKNIKDSTKNNSSTHFEDGFHQADLSYKSLATGATGQFSIIEIKVINDQIIQFTIEGSTFRKGDSGYTWSGGYLSNDGYAEILSEDAKGQIKFCFSILR